MAFFRQKPDSKSENYTQDFARFFGGLMPGVRRLQFFGHIGSGATAASTIYRVVHSSLSEVMQVGLTFASIAFMVFSILLIEGGLSKTLPYWAGQTVRAKFHNKWFILMYVALTIIVAPLLVMSPILSAVGGHYLVSEVKGDYSPIPTDSLENAYALRSDSLAVMYAEKSAAINANFDSRRAATKKRYAAQIRVQNNKYDQHRKQLAAGYTWAQGHMNKATAAVLDIKSERDAALDKIETERTAALVENEKREETAAAALGEDKNRAVGLVDVRNDKAEGKHQRFVSRWGGFAFWIGIFCSLLTVFCIFLLEIYLAGGGKDHRREEYDIEAGLFARLFSVIGAKMRGLFESLISWIENGKLSKPAAIGFKPSSGSKKAETFESSTVADAETALTKEEIEARVKQLRREIGSYEWKIRNNYGRKSTARMNIDRRQKQIKELEKKANHGL